MTLAGKECIPCNTDMLPMGPKEAASMLEKIPGWEVREGSTWLYRKFTFKNFRKSLAFVNGVGEIAEKHGHHPDITFGWGYAEIQLQTHKIGGLHENDFIVAADINAIEPDHA